MEETDWIILTAIISLVFLGVLVLFKEQIVELLKKKCCRHEWEKYNVQQTYGEDTDFAIRALSYGSSIKISNEITYYYIQHQDSLISTSKLKRFDYIPVLEDLALFFKNQNRNDLAELIHTSRIPKAIFGNMNYFFYNDYDYGEVIKKMKELDLFEKLSKFKGDKKFGLKIKLFLLNPKLYYILWKKFKNSI